MLDEMWMYDDDDGDGVKDGWVWCGGVVDEENVIV